MARNAEKAQSMLNRWVQGKKDAIAMPSEKRPYLASEVTNPAECERWRQQVIREVAKQVSMIQNGSLGEHKIRDLNDHINKLLREKKHWERQIKFLGGSDYSTLAQPILDSDGKRAIGTDGYYYFGAARDLPGVRELFDTSVQAAPKRTRFEMHKVVDAGYYGFRDDDDGRLIKLEKEQEKKAREQAAAEWAQNNSEEKTARLQALGMEEDEDDITQTSLRAHVVLPTEEEINRIILEKKKQDLLAKYGQ